MKNRGVLIGAAIAVVIIIFVMVPGVLGYGNEWLHEITEPAVPGWVQFDFRDEPGANGMLEQLRETAGLLGMDVEAAFGHLGPPGEMYPLRGDGEWQDDVVFHYPQGISLFWYDNIVWQVRVDSTSSFPVFSMTPEETETLLGPPFDKLDAGTGWVYLLPDQGYPVRLLLYFNKNSVDDIYIYRGDF